MDKGGRHSPLHLTDLLLQTILKGRGLKIKNRRVPLGEKFYQLKPKRFTAE